MSILAAGLASLSSGGAKRKGRTRGRISRYARASYVSREDPNVVTVCHGRHSFVCQGKHFVHMRKSKQKLKTKHNDGRTRNKEPVARSESDARFFCISYTSPMREHGCPSRSAPGVWMIMTKKKLGLRWWEWQVKCDFHKWSVPMRPMMSVYNL